MDNNEENEWIETFGRKALSESELDDMKMRAKDSSNSEVEALVDEVRLLRVLSRNLLCIIEENSALSEIEFVSVAKFLIHARERK